MQRDINLTVKEISTIQTKSETVPKVISNVKIVVCTPCGMYALWYVRLVVCTPCGMYALWYVRLVVCKPRGM